MEKSFAKNIFTVWLLRNERWFHALQPTLGINQGVSEDENSYPIAHKSGLQKSMSSTLTEHIHTAHSRVNNNIQNKYIPTEHT